MDFLGTCQVSKAEVQPALAARARTWAEMLKTTSVGLSPWQRVKRFGGYYRGP